jgi:hypothetical protein
MLLGSRSSKVLMRIVRPRVKAGLWGELMRRFIAIRANPEPIRGLRGRWILRDVDDPDACFVLGLWESEEAYEEFLSIPVMQDLIARPLAGDFFAHVCEVRSAWYAPAVTRVDPPAL